MTPRRSLSGLVIGLFAIVGALVATIFAVQLIAVVNLRGDTQNGRRATDLLTVSYNAELSVLDLETGVRGYLLTREARFLEPYQRAKSALTTQLASLRGLASGTTEKQRVERLVTSINGYINDFATPLIATGGRLSESQEVAAAVRGKQLVDAIRPQFAAIDNAQNLSRQRRRNMLANQTTLTIAMAAVGLALSILLLVGLGAYIVRSILRPIRRVADALEQGKGDLAVRVPEQGQGEVAQLGSSFNAMADALERRTRELSDANRRLEHAVSVAEEASRMKSDFLANMSHEIRTPLNGVVGMVTLLAGTSLSSEQREYVDMARTSSDTLINVVSDILDVSKIEAGRLELEQQDFDLHDLIGATRDMLTAAADDKGLRLSARVADDVPQAVRGDRLRVGQVVGNLLSNAVKFTAKGGIDLDVSVAQHTNVATVVRFAVRDTGMGIAPDRLATLFDPFTQADVSTTRQFGGTGLGLTICRDLARLMGGRIAATSQVGKGSEFVVSIPFAPAAGELQPPVPAVELRGLKVLIVDDNGANRRIFEVYTGNWGMRATSAHDAAHALTQLVAAADEGEPFDLALLDLNMPGESGIQLAGRISASPRLRGTRLILLSSTGAGVAEVNANGIRRQLTKPISQSSLLDSIASVMHTDLPRPGVPPIEMPAPETAAPPVAATPPAPAAAPPPRPSPPPVPAAGPAPAPARGSRILIAEDNLVNRTYVERLLERAGHKVTSAVDGRQVVALFESGSYDVILMDCQMPELDGYEATREIRRREAATGSQRIPIVAMTAAASEDIRVKCLDAGMDDYLTKPLGHAELQRALSLWLEREQASSRVLDPARLASLRSLFPGDESSTMLVRLTNEVTTELARLAAFVETGDRNGVGRSAHSIRGSAQMIGAVRMTGASTELELSAQDSSAPAEMIAEGLEALREAWAETRRAIEAQVEVDRQAAMIRSAAD